MRKMYNIEIISFRYISTQTNVCLHEEAQSTLHKRINTNKFGDYIICAEFVLFLSKYLCIAQIV